MTAPLVSIVTRTLGRDCLADAAASVAAQTYAPIEWVVVDAAGTGLVPPAAGEVPVRVVSAGERMLRSRALNAGLDAARGARALILDDDDLLLPHAVARLAAALDASPGHALAYGEVRVDYGDPSLTGVFAFEYTELMVCTRNLFPPNAALFDLALARERGVRVDESLDWFEDWDFWLALSAVSPFLRVREVTAIYREVLSQSGIRHINDPGADPRMGQHADRVIAKSAHRRAAAEARHRERKDVARRLEADGRLPEAAAAWHAAHLDFHYDPEPLLRYAGIARRAGDLAAARATLEAACYLMPDVPALAEALERARREAAAGA